MGLRAALRELLPRGHRGLRFEGDYASWEEAQRASGGYDRGEILQRVRAAELKVRQGEAADARDGVTFPEIQFSFPVMTALARAAGRNAGLRVLDFGGALGGLYRQYKALRIPGSLSWTVVEQKAYVELGRAEFAGAELQFADTLEGARADVVVLSSVLQYLPDPYALVRQVLDCGARHVVVDRTPCSGLSRDVLAVQHVPPQIYEASYPCWIFSRARLLDAFAKGFTTFAAFTDGSGAWRGDATAFELAGFIFDAR
ncbi:hypothetical protein AYO46_06655 [Betaproteobacteria bacterium SCGC AG-212-J23]|nr:hypothetical protein AYO46_06655 [Betaproteobacteria bacterium SCGC AG-212-J23]